MKNRHHLNTTILSLCGCAVLMAEEPAVLMGADKVVEEILQGRPAPLREIDGLPELRLWDFGAVPDDGENDLTALNAALEQVASFGGNTALLFEKGRYLLAPPDGPYEKRSMGLIHLDGVSNVIIDGQGAEIIIKRPDFGFCDVLNSTNVIIRNFTLDYDPLPFSQGTVVELNAAQRWIEVQTDPDYLDLSDPLFEVYPSWGMLKDPAFPGKLKSGAPNVLYRTACEKVGEGRFRITLAKPFEAFLEKGDRYAQIVRHAHACNYTDSEQVTFENITFHAVPTGVFVGRDTSCLNVLNCRTKLKPRRLLVSGADGVHCQAARIGPWVEGCEFEGLSDDCINIYTQPVFLLKAISDTAFRMSRPERIRSGDRLVFFRPRTGEILTETTVVSNDENGIVTLADAVSDLDLAPEGTAFNARTWKEYDHAYNLDVAGNYFVYRNNYLHDGRRYGAFIKASYGLIESNRFERLSDCGLCVQNEPDWPEGFWAQNLVIRGNQISDCASTGRLPVEISWHKLGHQTALVSAHANLFFEGNTVLAASGAVAQFDCINGLTLKDNVFKSGDVIGPLVIGEHTVVTSMRGNSGEERIQISQE